MYVRQEDEASASSTCPRANEGSLDPSFAVH